MEQNGLFAELEPVISKKRPMDRDRAAQVHEQLTGLLYGSFDEMVIAGSFRRGRAFVNDVEEVVRPRFDEDVNLLERRIAELVACGELVKPDLLQLDTGETRAAPWGEAYKRLHLGDVPIDLFIVPDPDCWGRQLVTRTGPWDFSKALVTPRGMYGFKPIGLECRDGGVFTQGGERIPVRSEREYFDVLEVKWLEPEERDRWQEILGRKAV